MPGNIPQVTFPEYYVILAGILRKITYSVTNALNAKCSTVNSQMKWLFNTNYIGLGILDYISKQQKKMLCTKKSPE